VAGEEPKAQHFVHRAYLEGFQDPDLEKKGDSFLWLYMPGKTPFRQRPERVAKRNYYYCFKREDQRQFAVEHGLQQIEDLAMPVLRRLRERDFTLAPENRLTFAGYVALSHTRVPTFQRNTDHLAALLAAKQLESVASNKRAIESAVAAIREKTGEVIDVEKFERDLKGGTVEISPNRAWSLAQMFEMMVLLQQVINDMHWTVLLAPENEPGFLTTDNPVSLFDPVASPLGGIGFASSPAAHFTFPISRDVCLLAQHQPGPEIVRLNGFSTRSVNKAVITRSDTQVYAPVESTQIQKIVDRLANLKEGGTKGRVMFSEGRVVEK
jgi:hypothetical protein